MAKGNSFYLRMRATLSRSAGHIIQPEYRKKPIRAGIQLRSMEVMIHLEQKKAKLKSEDRCTNECPIFSSRVRHDKCCAECFTTQFHESGDHVHLPVRKGLATDIRAYSQ